MTNLDKIFALMQSSDEKNRVLSLQLMENQKSLDEFNQFNTLGLALKPMEDGLTFSQRHFFYYQGTVNHDTVQQLKPYFEQALLYGKVPQKLLRKVNAVIYDLVVIMRPRYKTDSRLIWTNNSSLYNLGLSWIVSSWEYQHISNEFQSIDAALSSDAAYKSYMQRVAKLNWYGGMPEEDWACLTNGLQGNKYRYDFREIEEAFFEFMIWIKFDEENVK